jgi:serine/threonine protein kinase
VCSSIDSSGNDFKALVYEFMPRGDLHKLLYSTQDYKVTPDVNLLRMTQRMSILVDVADAMEYLHHNNQGTMAHVGDFGLARFKVGFATSSLGNPNSSSAGLMGTIGYAAPGNGPF